MHHRDFLLHLSLIDGVGPGIVKKIIECKPSTLSWHELYRFTISDWYQLGISEKVAKKIVVGLQDASSLDQELALIDRYQVQAFSLLDEQYPSYLKEIYAPPAILYCKGQAIGSDRKIAFVGSRQADGYGKKVIEQFIPNLVAHDCTIVSGGAIGADTMAHRSALDAGGKTIFVIGSGLIKPYPHCNVPLFEYALENGGTLVSIFPMRTHPHPGNFPARNRVIAGLSDGVVVIQAAKKSGTRITAQYALEQGRDVFAVPGTINDPLAQGCHELIKEGAKLVTSSHDILIEYGLVQKKEDKQQMIASSKPAKVLSANAFSTVEQKIISFCQQPQSADDLAAAIKSDLANVQKLLFDLQIKKVIEQDFTGLWKVI